MRVRSRRWGAGLPRRTGARSAAVADRREPEPSLPPLPPGRGRARGGCSTMTRPASLLARRSNRVAPPHPPIISRVAPRQAGRTHAGRLMPGGGRCGAEPARSPRGAGVQERRHARPPRSNAWGGPALSEGRIRRPPRRGPPVPVRSGARQARREPAVSAWPARLERPASSARLRSPAARGGSHSFPRGRPSLPGQRESAGSPAL
jgi:hypothetical protein